MPIPQETEIRRGILEAVKGGNPHNFSADDFLRITAEYFGEDIDALSANKSILKPLADGAVKYLTRHKLISNPTPNTYIITRLGSEILENTTGVIDAKCLKSLSVKSSSSMPDILQPLPVTEKVSKKMQDIDAEGSDENNGESQELQGDMEILSHEQENEALLDDIDMSLPDEYSVEQDYTDAPSQEHNDLPDEDSVEQDNTEISSQEHEA